LTFIPLYSSAQEKWVDNVRNEAGDILVRWLPTVSMAAPPEPSLGCAGHAVLRRCCGLPGGGCGPSRCRHTSVDNKTPFPGDTLQDGTSSLACARDFTNETRRSTVPMNETRR
ncbi:unnamed protein product, partial [Urochloa humidicola]